MANPRAVPVGIVAPAGQVGDGASTPTTRPKVRVEQTERQAVREDAIATMDLYYAEGELVHRRVPKAAKVEFPLRSHWSPTDLFPRWKAKRAVEWDDQREWKYLTALHNQSVEQLRMRFDRMEIQSVELMYRPGAPTVPATCLFLLASTHRSLSLTPMATSLGQQGR